MKRTSIFVNEEDLECFQENGIVLSVFVRKWMKEYRKEYEEKMKDEV